MSNPHALLQLNPPIPLVTPKGSAVAVVLIDMGLDYDLWWVCVQDDGGEIWTVRNTQVRGVKNWTHGRTQPTEKTEKT